MEQTKAWNHKSTKIQKKQQNVDSDSSFHLSDDQDTIKKMIQYQVLVFQINVPEFELQIENINRNNNDILCHVVDKDTPGPSIACTIAEVVRREQNEPNYILRNEKDKDKDKDKERSCNSTGSTKPNSTS